MRSLSTPPTKPFLKWAGSKRWIAPILQELYQPYRDRCYVAPFAGSGADVFGVNPRKAILGDRNYYLIELWLWVQRDAKFFIRMENDREVYQANRDRFNQLIREQGQIYTPERAQLFWYLNRNGFNGLCRFNQRGLFNVPFGKYKTVTFPDNLNEYKHAVRDWEFYCGDFEQIPLNPGDFLYLDPPYDCEFTSYDGNSFTWEDQQRVVEFALKHDGLVVISNAATDRLLELYEQAGLTIHKLIDVPRSISCKGSDRRSVKETIAIKR